MPENKLCSLTPHQARIQSSMEKLNVPAWYKPRPTPAADSPSAAATPPRGPRAGGGWRRHVTGTGLSRASTPLGDGSAAAAASSGLGPDGRTRWSSRTLPLSYRTGSTSSLLTSSSNLPTSTFSTPTSTLTRQPYLGWRSQVRIYFSVADLN